MNNKLLKVLNPLLFIALLVVVIAVALYKLPGEMQGSEVIGEVHEISGIAFFALGLLHIMLNWKWIKSQIFGIKPKAVRKSRKKKSGR